MCLPPFRMLQWINLSLLLLFGGLGLGFARGLARWAAALCHPKAPMCSSGHSGHPGLRSD